MKPAYPVFRLHWPWLLLFAVLPMLGYTFSALLRVVQVKVLAIHTSPTNPNWRKTELAVLSDYPPSPLLPKAVTKRPRYARLGGLARILSGTRASLCRAEGDKLLNGPA